MTSSISQNISVVAAKVVPVAQVNPAQGAEQKQISASDSQVAYAASQAAASAQSSLPKPGKSKVTQVPKRAESVFEKQAKKKKGKTKKDKELQEDNDFLEQGLDVLA